MGVCNQITLLILYYICSRLVTLLKVTDAPIPASDIFYRTVSFNLIDCTDILNLSPCCVLMSNIHENKQINISLTR